MPNFGVTNKDHYMCVMIFSGVVTCSSRLQGIAICKFLGWKKLVKPCEVHPERNRESNGEPVLQKHKSCEAIY